MLLVISMIGEFLHGRKFLNIQAMIFWITFFNICIMDKPGVSEVIIHVDSLLSHIAFSLSLGTRLLNVESKTKINFVFIIVIIFTMKVHTYF